MCRKAFLFGLIFTILWCLNETTKEGMCENPYKEACGKRPFKANEPVEYIDIQAEAKQKYQKKLASGFESRRQTTEPESNEVYQKARDYYEVCRSTNEFDVGAYFKELQAQDESLGWLNILHDQSVQLPSDWNWLKALAKLRNYGLNNVLLFTDAVRLNTTDSIGVISKPRHVDFDGAEQLDMQSLQTEMKAKVSDFKLKLQALSEDDSNSEKYKSAIQDLSAILPAMDLKAYFSIWGTLESSTIIQLRPDYLKSLNDLVTETPKDIVAYFLALKFASYLRAQLPKSNEPSDCIAHMAAPFAKAFDLIYEEQFDGTTKKESDASIDKIFKALKKKFLTKFVEHFSGETFKLLQEKLLTLQLAIGENFLNATKDSYNNFYKDLQVSKSENDAFYKNSLNAMRHLEKQSFQLPLAVASPWTLGYRVDHNLITLPRYILQYPIYVEDFTMDLKFGGLGNIIAHEMLQAFTPPGIYYDAYGNEILNNLSIKDFNTLHELDRCEHKIVYDVFLAEEGEDVANIQKENFFISSLKVYCTPEIGNYIHVIEDSIESIDDYFEVFQCSQKNRQKFCNL